MAKLVFFSWIIIKNVVYYLKDYCIFALHIRLTGNRSVSKTDSTPALMTVTDKNKRGVKSPFFVLVPFVLDFYATLALNQKLS